MCKSIGELGPHSNFVSNSVHYTSIVITCEGCSRFQVLESIRNALILSTHVCGEAKSLILARKGVHGLCVLALLCSYCQHLSLSIHPLLSIGGAMFSMKIALITHLWSSHCIENSTISICVSF